jgi:DNA-binding response OmpR family regulator
MLTARGDPSDRIEGLRRGADDYLAKPFDATELQFRIKALLRRSPRGAIAPAPLDFARASSASRSWSAWGRGCSSPLVADQIIRRAWWSSLAARRAARIRSVADSRW